MGEPVKRGDVVIVNFPFSDLSDQKRRPALVLAVLDRGDVLLAQITSKSYSDPAAVEIKGTDFASGSLPVQSFVRPGKLFAASSQLIAEVGCSLATSAYDNVVEAIVALIRR